MVLYRFAMKGMPVKSKEEPNPLICKSELADVVQNLEPSNWPIKATKLFGYGNLGLGTACLILGYKESAIAAYSTAAACFGAIAASKCDYLMRESSSTHF